MPKGTVLPLLLIALGLMVGIFGYWYLFKSPKINLQNPSTNSSKIDQLKTYTSTSLGFKLQYPKEFTVREDSEENFNKRGNGDFRKNFKSYVGYEPGKFLGAVVVLEHEEEYATNPLSLWVFDNPDSLTIEAWFDKYWYYPFLWGVFDFNSKGHVALDTEATVSGQQGRYKIVSYQPGKPKYIYISKDQKMYLFRISEDVGDKILSTFKFTN